MGKKARIAWQKNDFMALHRLNASMPVACCPLGYFNATYPLHVAHFDTMSVLEKFQGSHIRHSRTGLAANGSHYHISCDICRLWYHLTAYIIYDSISSFIELFDKQFYSIKLIIFKSKDFIMFISSILLFPILSSHPNGVGSEDSACNQIQTIPKSLNGCVNETQNCLYLKKKTLTMKNIIFHLIICMQWG